MSYKIGDKVKIKKHVANNCGVAGCATFEELGMAKYRGKVAKITRIKYKGFYKIDIDFGDWSWSDCMLEAYKKPVLNPIYEDIARLKVFRDRDFNGGKVTTIKNYTYVPCDSCKNIVKENYNVIYIISGRRYIASIGLRDCRHIAITKYNFRDMPTNEDFETFIKIFKTK